MSCINSCDWQRNALKQVFLAVYVSMCVNKQKSVSADISGSEFFESNAFMFMFLHSYLLVLNSLVCFVYDSLWQQNVNVWLDNKKQLAITANFSQLQSDISASNLRRSWSWLNFKNNSYCSVNNMLRQYYIHWKQFSSIRYFALIYVQLTEHEYLHILWMTQHQAASSRHQQDSQIDVFTLCTLMP